MSNVWKELVRINYFSRRKYSSKCNLFHLKTIARSPVFTHLNASIQGLTTIRAFNSEDILLKEYDNHQVSKMYYIKNIYIKLPMF